MIALLAMLAAQASDLPAVLDALTEELQRNVAELSLPEAPPVYHLRYQLATISQIEVEASRGLLIERDQTPWNGLGVELRLGDAQFDNTNFGGWRNGTTSRSLPAQLTPRAAKLDAWLATDRAYKDAIENYARKEAQFSPPKDYPGDYELLTGAPTQAAFAPAALPDTAPLEQLALDLSAAISDARLHTSVVHVAAEAGALSTLDTEGTRLTRPVAEVTIRALAHLRAADGMLLTDHRLWTSPSTDSLPTAAAMLAEVAALQTGLLALADAPTLDDEYVGPVLFADDAARDLFRYLLVPQVEGTPSPIPFDTFLGGVGERATHSRLNRRVLPPGWHVQDAPDRDPAGSGAMAYDLEGTPARAVDLVDDGIVETVLMSRIPRKDVAGTNGHARGWIGSRLTGRATQLVVEAPRLRSERAVHKQALKLAKAYGRDWYLVVRRFQEPSVRAVGAGGTMFSFGDDDSSLGLPPPLQVIRVSAKGDETTLRGARFPSADRWALRDIIAATGRNEGAYLATRSGKPLDDDGPTGGLPTWISAPSVLIGELELVPAPGDPREVPRLPPPSAP